MILVALNSITVTTPEGRAAAAAATDDDRAYPWHNPAWNRTIAPGESFETTTYLISDDDAARLVVEGYARAA